MYNPHNKYVHDLVLKLHKECTWSTKAQAKIVHDWYLIRDHYLNALAFTRGEHPEGNIAHMEDCNFVWTIEGITSIDGPCIVNPGPPTNVTNDDFIWYYVSSNYWGEGTPIYIDEEIS